MAWQGGDGSHRCKRFWEAEPDHQDYLQRYPNGYTCHFPRPDWVLPESSKSSSAGN